MNIMYAMDENYVEIVGVSIESLLGNNRDVDNIVIYLVEDSITESSRDKLRKTVEKYNREIVFIPKPDIRKLTGTDLLTLRWSDSAFSRLYLDIVFQDYPNVEKILYLDCDTLILDNLKQLWDMDVKDWLGAAVYECMSNMHKKIVGAKNSDNYFNTGVMLLNVKQWREGHISQICTDYIKARKGKIEYVDQGVVNGALIRELKVVESPRYNLTALSWDFSYEEMQVYRKPDHGYSKIQWENAKANPAIIHFTTSFLSIRPWFDGSETPWTDKWRYYKSLSEWKDQPLRLLKDRVAHDRKVKAFNMLPRRLAVGIAGLLHAYVKPIVFAIR